MPKHSFFTGQPIFSQLLNLISRPLVTQLSRKHQADRYCKRFLAYDHVVTLLYHSLFQCDSLRELVTGLQANAQRLQHLGLVHTPRRSTIADANGRRPSALFADLYHALYQKYCPCLPDSQTGRRLFIIDATTISLFSNVMQGAGSYKHNGRKKGGAKAHLLVDAAHNVPCFVRITEGKRHDQVFLPDVALPAGSTVVMDKAYINYGLFERWTQQQVTWVTRQKNDAHYTVMQQQPVEPAAQQYGIVTDKLVRCGRVSNLSQYPMIDARQVVWADPATGKTLVFLTNDRNAPPHDIAELYKRRWQIELLFKRIKQRYPLHYFLGDTPNAIEIQIWAALICDLLINIIRNKVNQHRRIKWSYANLSAMIKHHLMTYIQLIPFLLNPEKALLHYKPPDPQRLTLF